MISASSPPVWFCRTLCVSVSKSLLCVWLGIAAFRSAPAGALLAEDAAATQKRQLAAIEEDVKTEHFAQAADTLTSFLRTTPHSSANVYRLLAFSQYKLQKNYEALKTCELGLALYPSSRPLAEFYILILREGIPAGERQSRLAELLKQIPNSPILLRTMGEELMDKDPESTQALSFLSSAAKLSPRDAEAHFFYGESACFNKEDAVCIRELARAHEISPRNQYANMQIYTMIAVAEDRLRHPARAEEAFQQSMRANKQLTHPSPYAALKYINFLTTQGKDKEAMQVIDEILKWDISYGPAHFERAKILSRQGKTDDAAKEAELALQDSRGTPTDLRTYHAFLAKTYFALGREREARIHQNWIESHQEAGHEN